MVTFLLLSFVIMLQSEFVDDVARVSLLVSVFWTLLFFRVQQRQLLSRHHVRALRCRCCLSPSPFKPAPKLFWQRANYRHGYPWERRKKKDKLRKDIRRLKEKEAKRAKEQRVADAKQRRSLRVIVHALDWAQMVMLSPASEYFRARQLAINWSRVSFTSRKCTRHPVLNLLHWACQQLVVLCNSASEWQDWLLTHRGMHAANGNKSKQTLVGFGASCLGIPASLQGEKLSAKEKAALEHLSPALRKQLLNQEKAMQSVWSLVGRVLAKVFQSTLPTEMQSWDQDMTQKMFKKLERPNTLGNLVRDLLKRSTGFKRASTKRSGLEDIELFKILDKEIQSLIEKDQSADTLSLQKGWLADEPRKSVGIPGVKAMHMRRLHACLKARLTDENKRPKAPWGVMGFVLDSFGTHFGAKWKELWRKEGQNLGGLERAVTEKLRDAAHASRVALKTVKGLIQVEASKCMDGASPVLAVNGRGWRIDDEPNSSFASFIFHAQAGPNCDCKTLELWLKPQDPATVKPADEEKAVGKKKSSKSTGKAGTKPSKAKSKPKKPKSLITYVTVVVAPPKDDSQKWTHDELGRWWYGESASARFSRMVCLLDGTWHRKSKERAVVVIPGGPGRKEALHAVMECIEKAGGKFNTEPKALEVKDFACLYDESENSNENLSGAEAANKMCQLAKFLAKTDAISKGNKNSMSLERLESLVATKLLLYIPAVMQFEDLAPAYNRVFGNGGGNQDWHDPMQVDTALQEADFKALAVDCGSLPEDGQLEGSTVCFNCGSDSTHKEALQAALAAMLENADESIVSLEKVVSDLLNAKDFDNALTIIRKTEKPFFIAARVLDGRRERLVVNVGQSPWNGNTFDTHTGPASRCVRGLMRLANVPMEQAFSLDALPVNKCLKDFVHAPNCHFGTAGHVGSVNVKDGIQGHDRDNNREDEYGNNEEGYDSNEEKDEEDESNDVEEPSRNCGEDCIRRFNVVIRYLAVQVAVNCRLAQLQNHNFEPPLIVPYGRSARNIVQMATDMLRKGSTSASVPKQVKSDVSKQVKSNVPKQVKLDVPHPTAVRHSGTISAIHATIRTYTKLVAEMMQRLGLDRGSQPPERSAVEDALKLAADKLYNVSTVKRKQLQQVDNLRLLVTKEVEEIVKRATVMAQVDKLNLLTCGHQGVLLMAIREYIGNFDVVEELEQGDAPAQSVSSAEPVLKRSKPNTNVSHTERYVGSRIDVDRLSGSCYDFVKSMDKGIWDKKGPGQGRQAIARSFQRFAKHCLQTLCKENKVAAEGVVRKTVARKWRETLWNSFNPTQDSNTVPPREEWTHNVSLKDAKSTAALVSTLGQWPAFWRKRPKWERKRGLRRPIVRVVPLGRQQYANHALELSKDSQVEIIVTTLRQSPDREALQGALKKCLEAANWHFFKSEKKSWMTVNWDAVFGTRAAATIVGKTVNVSSGLLFLFHFKILEKLSKEKAKDVIDELYKKGDAMSLRLIGGHHLQVIVPGKGGKEPDDEEEETFGAAEKKRKSKAAITTEQLESGQVLVGGLDLGKKGQNGTILFPAVSAAVAKVYNGSKSEDTKISHAQNRGKGIEFVTAACHHAHMRTRERERERRHNLIKVNACLRGAVCIEDMQSKGQDFAAIYKKEDLDHAIELAGQYFPLLHFAYNSARAGQAKRDYAIRERRFIGQVAHAYHSELPKAVAEAAANDLHFLAKNIKQPATKANRARKCRNELPKQPKQPKQRRVEEAGDPHQRHKDPPRVEIGVDSFTSKGQKTTSGFPYMSLFRKLQSLTSSCTNLRVRFTVINGQYTSKTASPIRCILEGVYADMKDVTTEVLESLNSHRRFGGGLPDSFKYRYNPVSKALQQRDSGDPGDSCAAIRIGELLCKERLPLFTRQRDKLLPEFLSPHGNAEAAANGTNKL